MSTLGRQIKLRCLVGLGGILAGLSLAGCCDFWEEVTSHDFKFKHLYSSENPLVVLRDSNDGDKRAKAMLALKEPLTHGGTQQDQELVLKILTTAATNDRQPLCRMAAISSLGRFKDPRAVQALEAAFYNASNFPDSAIASNKDKGITQAGGMSVYSTAGISLDMPTQIQCQALVAMGETGSPVALRLLTRVVREPRGEGADEDRQEVLDRRMAAARALGKFHDPQAVEALAAVYRSEKDVALKDRVYDSLVASTGKKLPADPKAWDDALQFTTAPGTGLASDTTKPTLTLTGTGAAH